MLKACLFFFVVLPAKSFAATNFLISPTINYLDYREFHPSGKRSNREFGLLPGWQLGVNHKLNPHHELGITANWNRGSLHYDGQLQSGKDYQTQTRTELRQASLHYGYQIQNWQFGIELGRFNWDREILPIVGVLQLNEYYAWNMYSLTAAVATNGSRFKVVIKQLAQGKMRIEIPAPRYPIMHIPLKTGQELQLQWHISSEQAALKHVIFSVLARARYFPRSEHQGGYIAAEPENTLVQLDFQLSYQFKI